MRKKLNVAFFGAHPDDMESYAAGTLLKYREQGHSIFSVIATDGRWGAPKPLKNLAAIRKKEALAAAAWLKAQTFFCGLEDGMLVDDAEAYRALRNAYQKIAPDVVFTHALNDYHADHRELSRIVTDISGAPVFFADTLRGVDFMPQFYVDITSQFAVKKKMLFEHKSQHPEILIHGIEPLNRFRALQCQNEKIKFAECFRLFPRAGWVDAYELLP